MCYCSDWSSDRLLSVNTVQLFLSPSAFSLLLPPPTESEQLLEKSPLRRVCAQKPKRCNF